MYVTKNLFETTVKFIDMDDIEFFIESIQAAIHKFETEVSGGDIDKVKRQGSPVIFASTVTGKKKIDDIITRKSLNRRARRRFIMIDVDLETGQWDKYNKIRDGLIKLSDDYNAPLLIYPSLSYPQKPRFRAIIFTKNLLDKGAYYQAVSWLYDQLGVDILDRSDLNMGNNNAPLFINKEQIQAIYSNLDNPELEPLETQWKDYFKPKYKTEKVNADDFKKTEKDEIEITDSVIEKVTDLIIQKESYTDYNDFWKLVHSFVRANYFEQITDEQALYVLQGMTKVAKDVITEDKWKQGNKDFYFSEKERLTEEDLAMTKRLVDVDEFREVLLEN